jgi:hypothetical protein
MQQTFATEKANSAREVVLLQILRFMQNVLHSFIAAAGNGITSIVGIVRLIEQREITAREGRETQKHLKTLDMTRNYPETHGTARKHPQTPENAL